MPLHVVGASHRTAPIELRERLAFARSEFARLLGELAGDGSEVVALSTCNRTELYLSSPPGSVAAERARTLLAARIEPEGTLAARHLYVRSDREAVAHLFAVAAGLDSMIPGEPQIQGQVKEAYAVARELAEGGDGLVGPVLHRLFQTAFSVGGRVRSETGLGAGAASVPSAAVELAKKIFGSLRGRRALVLGAGEMSETTLECLRREGVHTALVANRTLARACELAERWGGEAVGWERYDAALPDVDIVVASTAAPHPVLTRERIRAALPGGARHPLCIIDIAIPRDVEPEVGREPNIFLYNVDDLQQVVADALGRRQSELPAAEAIVDSAAEEFWRWYGSLAVVPTIRALRERGETLRRAEVERVLRRLGHLSAEDRAAIDALTRTLVNKVLHAPTTRLREAPGNGRGVGVIDTARYLFELDPGSGDPGTD
jgi:glutamyl-tRNA reductase